MTTHENRRAGAERIADKMRTIMAMAAQSAARGEMTEEEATREAFVALGERARDAREAWLVLLTIEAHAHETREARRRDRHAGHGNHEIEGVQ